MHLVFGAWDLLPLILWEFVLISFSLDSKILAVLKCLLACRPMIKRRFVGTKNELLHAKRIRASELIKFLIALVFNILYAWNI
jgi:hypothetical protein